MASAVNTPYGASGGNSQISTKLFPKMDSQNPAKTVFELIRAGKYQDSPTEYGAKSVVKEYSHLISQSLTARCPYASFPGQNAGEGYIEVFLAETNNPQRFAMARQMSLVMRILDKETNFTKLVEVIASLQNGNSDADGIIRSLSGDFDIQDVVQTLVEAYSDNPPLLDVFRNLQANVSRVLGLDEMVQQAEELPISEADSADLGGGASLVAEGDGASSVDEGGDSSVDGDLADAGGPLGEIQEGGGAPGDFDPLENLDKRV